MEQLYNYAPTDLESGIQLQELNQGQLVTFTNQKTPIMSRPRTEHRRLLIAYGHIHYETTI